MSPQIICYTDRCIGLFIKVSIKSSFPNCLVTCFYSMKECPHFHSITLECHLVPKLYSSSLIVLYRWIALTRCNPNGYSLKLLLIWNELVRQYHWLNGHEFEQTPGDNRGQRHLECCNPLGHKEPDMTYQLNNSNYVEEATFHKSRWLNGLGQMPYLVDLSAHFFRYHYRGITFLQISESISVEFLWCYRRKFR